MADVLIEYYAVIGGRGYWRPSRKLRKLGFRDVPCGPHGPDAWSIAAGWNQRVEAAKRGEAGATDVLIVQTKETAEIARRYPTGSVGSAFQKYIVTDEWKNKAEGTRQKIWWPCWFRIRDLWGDVAPDSITFEQVSAWRTALVKTRGLDAAHKTFKVWRALWKVMRAMKIARGEDPSLAVTNNAPQPRSARWSEGEAVRLVKGSWRAGYKGLACVIAVAWDSTFSPVDVRTLRQRHLKEFRGSLIFDRSVEGRQKTGRAAIGTVCGRTQLLVTLYLAERKVEADQEAFLFCTRSGTHYRAEVLAHDFAAVRALVFPGDKRRLADMRRSGAAEAIAGNAKAGTLSAKMANGIETSNFLHKTYAPIDLASVRLADEARLRGRRRLRDDGLAGELDVGPGMKSEPRRAQRHPSQGFTPPAQVDRARFERLNAEASKPRTVGRRREET